MYIKKTTTTFPSLKEKGRKLVKQLDHTATLSRNVLYVQVSQVSYEFNHYSYSSSQKNVMPESSELQSSDEFKLLIKMFSHLH